MNPLLFPPALVKRALDDLSALADAARRLPGLEEQVLERIDFVSSEAFARVDALNDQLAALRAEMAPIRELAALRAEMAPIRELTAVREGVEPLAEDIRAVRHAVDGLEPLLEQVNTRLGAMAERIQLLRQDLGPLGELADKIPGIGA